MRAASSIPCLPSRSTRRRWRLRLTTAPVALLFGVTACTVADRDGPTAAPPGITEIGPRAAHTATALADGRILIAGGCVVDGCSAATRDTLLIGAEGDRVETGADMAVARTSHTATLLPDGEVLLAGGFPGENAGVTDSVELVDPTTGRIESLAPLRTARGGHASAPLPDGRVLVVGGWVARRTYTAAAELIGRENPGAAADLPWAADSLEATSLADGRVLVIGGQVASGRATAQAAVFDPRTGAWRQVSPMSTARFKHVAVTLADGRVLVAGGTSDDQTLLASTELFDPATGAFTAGPTLLEARYKLPGGAIAMDANRVLFAAGGRTAEVLDVAAGSSRPVGDLGGRASFATVSRLAGDRVLVLGGYDERIALRPRALVLTVQR